MRGKVKGCGFLALAVRITPAYAGKRGSGSLPRSCRRDHPRVCGEKVLLYSGLLYPLGSPPRVRGKVWSVRCCRWRKRITPACAGKRPAGGHHRAGPRDHPRVCGEKAAYFRAVCGPMGSPPRVRGKAATLPMTNTALGITPACAGKSPPYSRIPPRDGDHPRVCGEKSLAEGAQASDLGSPPRVRGKAPINRHQAEEHGITLAYAGKRVAVRSDLGTIRDHPRACGEKFHPASDRKLGRVQGTKRSSGPAPAAAPAGLAGSCPAFPPWSYPPRITVSRPRP